MDVVTQTFSLSLYSQDITINYPPTLAISTVANMCEFKRLLTPLDRKMDLSTNIKSVEDNIYTLDHGKKMGWAKSFGTPKTGGFNVQTLKASQNI